MDFIKGMYEEGLVEKKLDEDVWADIRSRRLDRANRERDVALYAYLVGIDNAYRATKFVEMAESGQGIPSNFAKAYLPIIDLIDDFVAAGPAGISRLKQAHKSIKSLKKR